MFNSLLVVFRKELTDALRDKRSLRLALLMPMYFIAIFVASAYFAIHLSEKGGSGATRLAVAGAEHLPELAAWLREQGVQLEEAPDNMDQALEQRELDYGLIIPPEAAEQYAGLEPATLWLVYDASKADVHSNVNFVRQQIYAWNRQQAGLRILSRGVSPELLQPVHLRESNVASDQRMSGYLLISLPMFILICTFIGSVGFSADMTAGERERRSLESLLITPASSRAIILGKWCTSVLLTLVVVTILMTGLGVAMAHIPFNKLGLRVDVGITDLLLIGLVTLPIILLAVGLQMLVAIFARSFKDAQTYIGLLIFIPLLPFIYTTMNPGDLPDGFFWIPVLAQQIAIKELLVGSGLHWLNLAQMWFSAIPLMFGVLVLTAKQLRRAKMVY